MKKTLCLCLSILVALSLYGCGCAPRTAPETPTQEQPSYTIEPAGTPLPMMADDETQEQLGVYGEYVFGIVMRADDSSMILKIQDKYFEFAFTEKAKRHYVKLGVKLGNEVAVPYSTDEDGNYIADDVELVE